MILSCLFIGRITKHLRDKQRLGHSIIEAEVQAIQRLETLKQQASSLKAQMDRSTSDLSFNSESRSLSSQELQTFLKHRQETPDAHMNVLKPSTPSLASTRTFITSVPSTINESIQNEPRLIFDESSSTQLVSNPSSSMYSSSSVLHLSRMMSKASTRQSIVFRDSLNQSHIELKALARLRSNRLSVRDNAAKGEYFF